MRSTHVQYAAKAFVLAGAFAVITLHGASAFAAASGTISGTIKVDGTVPKGKAIDMSKEPSCAAKHPTPITSEQVMAGTGGNTLENVVVYISAGLQGSNFPMRTEPVTIDQNGCQYKPHMIVLQVNEDMKVINSDQTSHNIHPMPKQNTEWNKSQPAGAPPIDAKFTTQEVGIPVKCNIHPWMRSYISVFNHPFFAVSDKDGKFTIKNVPPGTYTVSSWQETLGTQTTQVTVAAGQTAAATFTYKTK